MLLNSTLPTCFCRWRTVKIRSGEKKFKSQRIQTFFPFLASNRLWHIARPFYSIPMKSCASRYSADHLKMCENQEEWLMEYRLSAGKQYVVGF